MNLFLLLASFGNFNFWNTFFLVWWLVWKSIKVKSKQYFSRTDLSKNLLLVDPCPQNSSNWCLVIFLPNPEFLIQIGLNILWYCCLQRLYWQQWGRWSLNRRLGFYIQVWRIKSKGQEISKWNFAVSNFPKKQWKHLSNFCASL